MNEGQLVNDLIDAKNDILDASSGYGSRTRIRITSRDAAMGVQHLVWSLMGKDPSARLGWMTQSLSLISVATRANGMDVDLQRELLKAYALVMRAREEESA